MDITPLLSDSVFKMIEGEFLKRAKARSNSTLGEADYKVALEALISRALEVCVKPLPPKKEPAIKKS